MRHHIEMLNKLIKPLSVVYDKGYDLPWLVMDDKENIISQHNSAQCAYDSARIHASSYREHNAKES